MSVKVQVCVCVFCLQFWCTWQMADLKEKRVCTKFYFEVGEKWYRNLRILKVAS